MRSRWLLGLKITTSTMFILPILLSSIACPSSLVAQQAYTNADVIKMVQAHLGVSVIVEQIRSNPGHYLLTPDSLIRLQREGVPDEVVQAMQAKKSSQVHPETQIKDATAAAPGNQSSVRSKTGVWKAENKVINQMTGETQWQASAALQLPGRDGEAEVTATCPEKGITTFGLHHALWFQIRYIPGPGKDVGIVASQPPATVITQNGPAMVYGGKYGPGVIGRSTSTSTVHQQPKFTTFEFNIDGKHGQIRSTSPEPNTLVLRFEDGIDRPLREDEVAAIGSLTEGFGAKTIRLQLPLTNGDKPIIEIHPQDQSFREFIAKCPVPGAHVGKDYTVETFESTLRQTLARTARDRSLGDHYYDKDLTYISNAVETCSKLDAAVGQLDGPQYPVCKGGHGWGYESQHFFIGTFENVNASTVTRYVNYAATGKEWVNERFRPNSILLKIDQIGDHKWGDGFYVWVKILEDDGRSMSDLLTDAYIKPAGHLEARTSPALKNDSGPKAAAGDGPVPSQSDPAKQQDKTEPQQLAAASQPGTALTSVNGGGSVAAPSAASSTPASSSSPPSTASQGPSTDSVSKAETGLPVPTLHDGVAGKAIMKFLDKCSMGDAKGCEMVGFDVERGWGADRDAQVVKAYYAKACSLGRKSDCGK